MAGRKMSAFDKVNEELFIDGNKYYMYILLNVQKIERQKLIMQTSRAIENRICVRLPAISERSESSKNIKSRLFSSFVQNFVANKLKRKSTQIFCVEMIHSPLFLPSLVDCRPHLRLHTSCGLHEAAIAIANHFSIL